MNVGQLGDAAALARFPDEGAALRFAEEVRRMNEDWLIDIVQAYATVAVYFDLNRTRFETVAERLQRVAPKEGETIERKSHRIPCCYEFAPDLSRVAKETGFKLSVPIVELL